MPRRVQPADNAQHHGEPDRAHHQPRRDQEERLPACRAGRIPGGCHEHTQGKPTHPAEEPDDTGLEDELHHHLAVGSADGFADANLTGPLGDRHGHGVDDRQPSDQQRYRADRVDDRCEDRQRRLDLFLELDCRVGVDAIELALCSRGDHSGLHPLIGVDREVRDDGRRVHGVLDHVRQVLGSDLLRVGERHVDDRVRRRERLVDDADDLVVLVAHLDLPAHLGAELVDKVGTDSDLTVLKRPQRATL
jgi:hypothetical protein